jgi:SAM-dependent methyltransferase
MGHAIPTATSSCTVCDGVQATPRFTVEDCESPIVVCNDCGLGRFEPMLTSEEVARLYPPQYYGAPGAKFLPLIEWAVRAVAARHIRFLSAGLEPGARILDVGCGRGVILSPLADLGFEVHGVEISEQAARGADARASIRIADDLSAAGYEADEFDQIVLWHVLEHLRDPRGTLMECHRILKTGGRLVVAIPNFSSWQARFSGAGWFHLDAPRHLFHFPLAGLRELLGHCGFQCQKDYHFSLRQNPFGWIQSVQNRLDPEHPNRLYAAMQGPGQPKDRSTSHGSRNLLAVLPWLLLGTLPALFLSILAAVFRSGATVHTLAIRMQRSRES